MWGGFGISALDELKCLYRSCAFPSEACYAEAARCTYLHRDECSYYYYYYWYL